MPTVPTYDLPQVKLDPGLNFRDNTRATGEQFGAGIGRALGAVGQGVADVGQAVQQVAMMDAVTSAKEAKNITGDKLRGLQYGQDGSGGYLSLQGRPAVDGAKGYEASVDQAIRDGASGLSPLAQRIYNEETQQLRASALQVGSVHALNERSAWYVQTTANELDQYSKIYVDPAQSDTERARAGAEISRIIEGGEKSGQLTPQQAEAFRTKFVDGSEATYAKLFIDSNRELYAPTGDPALDTAEKIIKIESGGNPNAANPRSSASGVGQFTDGTWLSTVRSSRPDLAGKADAEILALKSDPALGREMTVVLMRQNADALRKAGLPVTEGNLYLAHFAGSEGAKDILTADPNASVESILGAKVVAANPFLKNKTAAWLQTWASQKMGRVPTGPLPPNFGALRPEQKQAVLDDIQTISNDQKVYVRSIIDGAIENAPVAIQNTGRYSGNMPTEQQFVAAYGADGAQKFEAFGAAVETSKNIFAMRSMTNSQITEMVKAATPSSSGDNADLEAKTFASLSQAASTIIEQRKADPVGYVQRTFPSVAAAWDGVTANTVPVEQAIKQTVAAQLQIGIAPQDVQPLPREIATKAVAAFKADALPERDRANAVLALFGLTNDPDQQAAIYRNLVKEGLPEYAGGAVRAALRGDEGAANRLMTAALMDPTKIPGSLPNKEAEIKEEIQNRLMAEGEIGDVFYGLSSGNLDGLQRAAADSTLLTRAVQQRLRQGESLADAVEAAGKDLYGDVQRVTGDSRVQTNILLPSDTDPAPVLDGLAASKIDVYQALKSVADRAVEQAPAGDGAKAVVREAARSRIEDIMSNGFFVQAGNGYAFFDPYVGQPVSDETGKPLIFDEKTVEERGKAAPPPGEGDMGARLDPVARKMMGLDLVPQDAWKPLEAAQ